MKVTYLAHDGFAVALDDVLLVFDDVHDPSHSVKHYLANHPYETIIYFISHKLVNNQHFNPATFERTQNHRMVYVVSNSVPAMFIPSTLDVAGMSHGDVIDNLPGGITVKAYEAYKGVSFMVTTKDGRKIFHAGDLNDWFLPDNSDPKIAQRQHAKFQTIIGRIASENPTVDVAMMSVNPRIGQNFAQGASELTAAIDVKHFFPMDIDGDRLKACDFSYLPERTKGYCLTSPGEHVNI